MKIGILFITVLAIMGMVVSMLEARCPKCGLCYYGWALRNPVHQTCPKCGRLLEIRNSNNTILKGYSPFTTDGYHLKPPKNIVHSKQKDNDIDLNDA